jgi:hypothetical protein
METNADLSSFFDVNNTTEEYRHAMKKLLDASVHFDKDKPGGEMLMKALESRCIEKSYFLQALRTFMDCKLTPEELELLMHHFNNEGMVNGCDFIILFFRLRYEYRNLELKRRIEYERKVEQEDKERMKKRDEDYEKKLRITIKKNYNEDHLNSAMKKLSEAAIRFERLYMGNPQLRAFDSEYLQPEMFK